MPTTKTPTDEFEYDTALLPHQGISNDGLDLLDNIADARSAASKLIARLNHMQQMIEHHAPVYGTREQFAVDLEVEVAHIRTAMAGILGADGNA